MGNSPIFENTTKDGNQYDRIPFEILILIIFLVICVVFLIVYIIWKVMNMSKRIVSNIIWPLDKKLNRDKWNEIEGLFHVKSSQPLCIIYGCSLVDHALKKRKYPGDTMSRRLKSAEYKFRNRKGVWKAFGLRNEIAHEITNRSLTKTEMQQALKDLRQALNDLDAL